MKITIFSEELRKCLNAAGLSDCGENDTWNYWYQRLMNAYNESVERQIMTEQAENAKLHEKIADLESRVNSHRARAQYWHKVAQDMASHEIERLEAAKRVRDMLASKRHQEFVGHSVIDHVTSDGPAFCQWLDTDEPITRCVKCKAFLQNETPNDHEHPHFCTLHGSDLAEPDGFCAWGEVDE